MSVIDRKHKKKERKRVPILENITRQTEESRMKNGGVVNGKRMSADGLGETIDRQIDKQTGGQVDR